MDVTGEQLFRFLAKTAIFDGFTKEDVEVFLPSFKMMKVEADHTIFEEGAIGDAWYVVLKGEVAVTKSMPHGPPHVLAHMEEGDCFGEMALLDGAPRMASLYTVTDTVLARLDREDFMQMLREKSMPAIKLLWAMSSMLCVRQRDLTHVLADLVEVPMQKKDPEYMVLNELLRTHVTWN